MFLSRWLVLPLSIRRIIELHSITLSKYFTMMIISTKEKMFVWIYQKKSKEEKTSSTSKQQQSSIKRYRKIISQSPTPLVNSECIDSHNDCAYWLSNGECDINQYFMYQYCKKSCGVCDCEDKKESCSMLAEMGEYENDPLCAVPADDSTEDTDCKDKSPVCGEWAAKGQCKMNPEYMSSYCKSSCNECNEKKVEPQEQECKDSREDCISWATHGECEKNPNYMTEECKKSCRVCTVFDMGVEQTSPMDKQELLSKAVKNMTEYYMYDIIKKEEYIGVRDLCKNKHEKCAYFALLGECKNNLNYMNKNCALACRTCDQLDIKVRCPSELKSEDALKPGDLEKMFLKITNTTDYAQYQPVTLSKPSSNSPNKTWVILLDSFLTPQECDAVIKLGEQTGFAPSKVGAKKRSDGFYDSAITLDRTSTNTWCINECNDDLIIQNVTQRIVNMTGIPEPNMENFQLLKYTAGQYYLEHHDFNVHHIEGPRMLTFFMYLNDVESGGETNFTKLGITIKPKKGRVVLWQNVLESDFTTAEEWTYHESLSVNDGVKYAANAWIHLNDFKTPMALGCTG